MLIAVENRELLAVQAVLVKRLKESQEFHDILARTQSKNSVLWLYSAEVCLSWETSSPVQNS